MKNHFHWIVYCYNDNIEERIVVDILAKELEQATTKAARIIPMKENYQVVQVIEHMGDNCNK